MVKCSCKYSQIFVQKSSHFLNILLANPLSFSAKHVNLQLAQTPVFDQRFQQYTQSICIVKDVDMLSLFISLISCCFFYLKKSCSWSLIFKSEYYEFIFIFMHTATFFAFIYYIIFQIIYIIRIFTIFQKVTKMACLLWGNIHLHTIKSLQYLPPDVRHFAYNAIGEAGKKQFIVDGFGCI